MTNSDTPQSPTDADLLRSIAHVLGLVTEPVPAVIPDPIMASCELFLDGDLEGKELEDFYQLAKENPWVITLLRDFERWNPGWRQAQEEWEHAMQPRLRNRFMQMLPQVEQEFDFSILFEPDANAMDIAFNDRGTSTSQLEIASLEMAHGDVEQTSIKHTRSTDHFQLAITIGYSSTASFHMGIQIRALDVRTVPQHCRVRISKLPSQATEHASTTDYHAEATPDAESQVEFDDLMEGGYKIEFFHQGESLESFTMQIARKG
jgi:hypothetical protein